MQRPSEPQVIAERLDNLVPVIARKLLEDGEHDELDRQILGALSEISDRTLRHAEVIDLTISLTRVGHTKRNDRRLRELFPNVDDAA